MVLRHVVEVVVGSAASEACNAWAYSARPCSAAPPVQSIPPGSEWGLWRCSNIVSNGIKAIITCGSKERNIVNVMQLKYSGHAS